MCLTLKIYARTCAFLLSLAKAVVINGEVSQGENVIENKEAATNKLCATAWLDAAVAAADVTEMEE